MASSPPPAARAVSERLLLRLEWRVLRRLEGQLAGGYRTARRGIGTDLAGLREYMEGDDARHIDWNVTARLNETQIRVFSEDRDLTLWLVLDRSASMTAGPPGRGKHEVLTGLALVLARMFSRGGNRVGAILYDTGFRNTALRNTALRNTGPGNAATVRLVPPGTGRGHVLRIGAELARTAGGGPAPNGTTDLAAMLDAAGRIARRRALIIVISDFIGDGDWERSLLRLAPRHEVVALRVTDAADDELPDAGLVVVEDAETGEQLVVDSGDPLLRARLSAGVADRDARLVAGMRRAAVPLHRIDTTADLATALVEVVLSTQRRRA
ncbi:MAG TPA: DUF58 domain-containing protein [Trebonia sp.]|nr:DUF58 domain-containing protein [Trebonia sp.]